MKKKKKENKKESGKLLKMETRIFLYWSWNMQECQTTNPPLKSDMGEEGVSAKKGAQFSSVILK